jgi:histidinol phosphatase-like PHP family hydrolase
MGYLQFGVAMARRGWLQASDVLNTLDAAAFVEAVRP